MGVFGPRPPAPRQLLCKVIQVICPRRPKVILSDPGGGGCELDCPLALSCLLEHSLLVGNRSVPSSFALIIFGGSLCLAPGAGLRSRPCAWQLTRGLVAYSFGSLLSMP